MIYHSPISEGENNYLFYLLNPFFSFLFSLFSLFLIFSYFFDFIHEQNHYF